jgi:hypothetical protein
MMLRSIHVATILILSSLFAVTSQLPQRTPKS